jgi:hypothetical protein
MPIHPATDYNKFQTFIEPLLELLFQGFRLHKTEHFIRHNRDRLDFSLINNSDHRVRLVVDAKFRGEIARKQVEEAVAYRRYPFCARHSALIFPEECEVRPSAKELADEKRVMLVRLGGITKDRTYARSWRRLWIYASEHDGFDVGCKWSSVEEIVQNAEWITGPYHLN